MAADHNLCGVPGPCCSPTPRTCSTAPSTRCPTRSRARTAARSTRCWARSTSCCGASSATSRARSSLLRAGVGHLPDGALPAVPRPPPADARRARAPVGAGAGALRGARLEGRRPRLARGRRPDARLRDGRGRGGRPRADPHRRPRHVPVRARRRHVLLQRARQEGPDEMGAAEVEERYGIAPALVPDFIALRGDPSDGLPGAKGIGEKTAADLLRRHGSLEAAIAARHPRAARGPAGAARAGRRAARVQGHRDAARRRGGAPARTARPTAPAAPPRRERARHGPPGRAAAGRLGRVRRQIVLRPASLAA